MDKRTDAEWQEPTSQELHNAKVVMAAVAQQVAKERNIPLDFSKSPDSSASPMSLASPESSGQHSSNAYGQGESLATLATSLATSSKNSSTISNSSERLATLATLATPKAENVIPLRSTPTIQKAYPTDAFGSFAEAVKALSQVVKVPEAMAGSSILTTLAFCAQGIANVHMLDGRYVPISLYCLTIGDSGDRKTALDSVVSQAIKKVEREQYITYQQEMQAFELAKKDYEQRSKKEKDLFSFEMEAPKNPAMIQENINAEGLFRSFKEGRPSLAVFSDEGGTLFGGTAFQKENALKSITFFSKLWDGSSVDKVRAGEGFSRLYDRRLSMHLMLQPAIAEKVLSDELYQGQGFLPRFLLAWPQSLKGTRTYQALNVRNNKGVQDFYQVCDTMLRIPLKIEESTGAILFDGIDLESTAHELWVKHHDVIEKLLVPDGGLSIISANASKCAEQTLRIAGVLTLAENPHSRTITGKTMAHAIALSQWYIKEALRLRQNGVAPAEILQAEKLLAWLDKKEIRRFSISLIIQKGPRSLRLKKKAEEAIRVLEEHGHVRRGVGSELINGVTTKSFWERVTCA